MRLNGKDSRTERLVLLLRNRERQIKPLRPTKENKSGRDSDLFHRGNNSSFFTWECFEIPAFPPQASCLREAYLIIWEQQAEAVTNHEQSRTGDQAMTTMLRFMGTGCYGLSSASASSSFSRSAIVREIDFPSLSPATLLTINSQQ